MDTLKYQQKRADFPNSREGNGSEGNINQSQLILSCTLEMLLEAPTTLEGSPPAS